jgi:hypothetical protein
MESNANAVHRQPWNKGTIVGQKALFKLRDIWALRVRLQMESRVRELAFFNLGIDSKLRGCDLVSLKVRDICHGDQVATRAVVMQHNTQRPVQFEITPATREAVQKWIKQSGLRSDDFVFPSLIHDSPHLQQVRARTGCGLSLSRAYPRQSSMVSRVPLTTHSITPAWGSTRCRTWPACHV